jgi:Flp pilus assembly protein TadD/ketosteroid isomerase-like protein
MGFRQSIRLTSACIAAAACLTVAHAAPADDLAEASKLYQQNKLDAALGKTNGFLTTQPKDPQGRFLKGLILTEQRKTGEAIQVFTGLTEDFPELPEPYNNLAVLYASQGNYDKAKAALELAIHTHPSYATAHENLGDIYAQLARRAYDKALQLDKNNATAQAKLAMIKDLFSAPKNAAGQTAPMTIASAAPVKPESAKQGPAQTATTVAAKPTPTPAPAPAPGANGTADSEAQVTAAVSAWAKAWSDKDANAYLAFYASDFATPNGESRKAWEQQRRDRIEKAKSIAVTVKVNSVSINGSEAVVTLRQSYRSDTFKTTSTKTLHMVRIGDKWQIRQERVAS